MSSWIEWKRANANKIFHEKGFEEKFVDVVLSRIPAICPADVVPQYGFLDDRGVRRRIDFMVINPQRGYLLPIELDGRNKPNGGGREDWNDFLERQNALIRSFGTVLRYSNSKMFNNPQEIVREISELLLTQEASKRAGDRRRGVLNELDQRPPQAPPSLPASEPSPHFNRLAWLRDMTACLALLATVLMGYFIWQNGARPYAVAEKLPAGTVSIGLTETTPNPVAVQDVTVPQTPSAQNSVVVSDVATQQATLAAAQISVQQSPQATSTAHDGFSPSGNFILTSQARAYVGHYEKVCGNIAGSKELATGLFINFDKAYPNEPMDAVIWRQNISAVGDLLLTENRKVCISGMIGLYHGKPQIEVKNREQISP